MKKAALHNLGCKVNSYEYDVMLQKLKENGFEIVPFSEKADVYIVNTCSVTNMADRKSRQMLHRAKALNPDALVVATGCYVQTGAEALKKDPEVDLLIGNNRKNAIAETILKALEERAASGKRNTAGATIPCHDVIDINATNEYEEMSLTTTAEHTRATIKIQDGCNQFCSYCIIPYARGRVRSREEGSLLEEIRRLGEQGYREFVITGIHLSSYGVDFEAEKTTVGDYMVGKSRLPGVLEAVSRLDVVERIRLGSLEPRIITDSFLAAMRKLNKLCPHFHLSLQSACNETLRRMNRHYSIEEYAECVRKIREVFPQAAITTDVIVGFPGETEEEFAKTVEKLRELNLYEIHVFKYSKRAGTVAATMPNQVPEEIKNQRSDVLLELTKKQSTDFRQRFVGSTMEVLFEEEKTTDGQPVLAGYSKEYVYCAVPGKEALARGITSGTIARVTGGKLSEDGGAIHCFLTE